MSHDAILGRSTRREWTTYSVKGSLLSARPRYVAEQWGDAALRDVLGRLEAKARATLESPILPFTWYPFDVLAAVDAAIIEGPMKGDMSQMRRFGSAVARYDLPTLYKVMFKLGTPAFLIKRVGVVYGTYVRGGKMHAEVTGKTANVTLTEGSLPRYFCQQGVSGWFSAALELSGGRAVHVKETHCVHESAPHCRWEATWE